MRARWLLAVVTLLGCLPEDTRDTPGMVTVKVRGSDDTIDGFDTQDGWRVQFERVFVTVGVEQLEGCEDYTEGDYFRIMDGRAREPQLLGVTYGLGSCGIKLRAGNPFDSSLLGAGVTEADRTRMLVEESTVYEPLKAGVTFWIRGRADRSGTSKAFEWLYRRRGILYEECALPARLQLTADVSLGVELRVNAASLFEDPNGVRRFDPFAVADIDGDGTITLEELEKATGNGPLTLGRYLYDVAFPAILRVGETGRCKTRIGRRGPE